MIQRVYGIQATSSAEKQLCSQVWLINTWVFSRAKWQNKDPHKGFAQHRAKFTSLFASRLVYGNEITTVRRKKNSCKISELFPPDSLEGWSGIMLIFAKQANGHMKWSSQVDECSIKYVYVCKYAPNPPPPIGRLYVKITFISWVRSSSLVLRYGVVWGEQAECEVCSSAQHQGRCPENSSFSLLQPTVRAWQKWCCEGHLICIC